MKAEEKRICDVCSEAKPLSEFYLDSSSTCKQCEKARFREEHRECLKQYRAEYRRVEEKGIIASARRSHHRRTGWTKSTADLSSGQWALILMHQKFRCKDCGKKFSKTRKPTIDHILPLSKGGHLSSDNVQALCKSCNSRKHDNLV